MISIILWALAPIFNAIMDLVENENFYQSIFSRYNEKLWYKRESWKYAKKLFGYKFDAWHISKSLMIFSIVLSTILIKYESFLLNTGHDIIDYFAEIIIRGTMWNVIFTLFYHKLFRLKQYRK